MSERVVTVTPVDLLTPYRQKSTYSCGPACLVMVYACYGIKLNEREISEDFQMDKEYGMNFMEMMEYVDDTDFRIQYESKSNVYKLLNVFVKSHAPIIVGIQDVNEKGESDDHFCVVKDITTSEVTLADPMTGQFKTIDIDTFNGLWHIDEADHAFLLIKP